jgi:D-psicose/D-tagatose/L-ribulose 3-epimerase
MVQFGCCLPGASFVPQAGDTPRSSDDPVAAVVQGIDMLAGHGYDFAELTVGTLTGLSEDDFARMKAAMLQAKLAVPVLNSFIPPHLKLTGPDVDGEAIDAYLRLAFSRVKEIGAGAIIFGSGGARSYPDGFSRDEALEQIGQFLQLCSRYAVEHGIVVAIEPLNRKESNVIHTVQEALELAQRLNLPHIQVLADSYHMLEEREPLAILQEAVRSGLLAHVHIADRNRQFPGLPVEDGMDFGAFFHELYEAGYAGRVSAECSFADFAVNSGKSLDFVKALWASTLSKQTGSV